jgi:tetratricopeptide (TPR) repeat protein
LCDSVKNLDLWILNNSEIEELKEKAQRIVLTDDYAPVEHLLAPVVLKSAMDLLAEKYLDEADKLKEDGKWEESIAKYKDVIDTDPAFSLKAYNGVGMILASQGKLQKAIDTFKSALEYNSRAEVKQSMSNIHYNIGVALQRLGNNEEASEHLNKAIQGYREDLLKKPDSIKIVSRLGNALATVGNFNEATRYFQQAVNLGPHDIKNHLILAQVLAIQQRYDEAIAGLNKAIAFMSHLGNKEAASELQKQLKLIESKKSEQEK